MNKKRKQSYILIALSMCLSVWTCPFRPVNSLCELTVWVRGNQTKRIGTGQLTMYLQPLSVRFHPATTIVDAASNPLPLQFVPEISKLPRMLQQPVDCHNRHLLWCLFGLLLHFDPLLSFCSFLYCCWNFFLCLKINCRMCFSHQESGIGH